MGIGGDADMESPLREDPAIGISTATQDPGPRTQDSGARRQDPGPLTQDPGPWTQEPGPRNQGGGRLLLLRWRLLLLRDDFCDSGRIFCFFWERRT